jgi:pimeloyl-ACP methyl ester carboxylesterase
MKTNKRSSCIVQVVHRKLLLVVYVLFFAGMLAACERLNAPRYEETECPFSTDSSHKIECGILKVPEDRSQEEGPMIELHFAIIHSRDPDKLPDPVVALQGGPGGLSLDAMDYWLYILGRTLVNRDVIVFDQRGVGYSQPSLNCPELEEPYYAHFANDLSSVEQDEIFNQALKTCRDRLVQEGVNLSAYNSAASAADVDDLRRALGYSEWNLYGSSYGTRLALTVMRDFPQGVRSVILDSVYPPQEDLFSSIAVDMQRALDLLFERCAADPECSQSYPNLEQVFYDVVHQVDAQPVTLEVYRPSDLEKYDVLINGDRLIRSVYDLLYWPDDIADLPKVIYEIAEGDWETFSRKVRFGQFLHDDLSEGLYYSVECVEEAPFGSPQDVTAVNAAVKPRLSQAMNNTNFYKDCAAWDVAPAAAIENQAVVSDIPTLILSGEHDPITPPAWGFSAAENLSRAQYLVFPGAAHGVLGSSGCTFRVLEAFLSAPEEPVEASCVAELPTLFGGD